MPTTANQVRRRRAIAELLESHVIRRQSELVRLLRANGLDATQTSVSRDLRDLGAAKLTAGYRLPEPAAATTKTPFGRWLNFFGRSTLRDPICW